MIAFRSVRVEKIKADIRRFRGVISGCKIMHLSDLHISRFGRHERKLVSLVNRENPDIILITGDLVNSYQKDFDACIHTLKKLNARHGIFAVFGNAEHTFRPAGMANDFGEALEEINITLLNNRSVELKLNGKNLYLVGVDDPFFFFDKFDQAVHGVPEGAPSILLAHSPDILVPRADAIVVNLLDSELKSDHFRGWGWEDSTRFGPEKGDVYFVNDGVHTIRVQSRQDGVSLDTILLNPYEDIDRILDEKDISDINVLLRSGAALNQYPDLIVISAGDIKEQRIFGKWKKEHDPMTLFNYRLDDLPPEKWRFLPMINPADYFEADFTAKKDTKYHVWLRMKAHNGSPFNDSVYLQFDDSADENGRERYRIGRPVYSKDRLGDMDLILTGHTHGGQIRLPVYGPLTTMTSLGKKYAEGLHKFGNSAVYISRGFGTSVIPFRFLCPPEITVFAFN